MDSPTTGTPKLSHLSSYAVLFACPLSSACSGKRGKQKQGAPFRTPRRTCKAKRVKSDSLNWNSSPFSSICLMSSTSSVHLSDRCNKAVPCKFGVHRTPARRKAHAHCKPDCCCCCCCVCVASAFTQAVTNHSEGKSLCYVCIDDAIVLLVLALLGPPVTNAGPLKMYVSVILVFCLNESGGPNINHSRFPLQWTHKNESINHAVSYHLVC